MTRNEHTQLLLRALADADRVLAAQAHTIAVTQASLDALLLERATLLTQALTSQAVAERTLAGARKAAGVAATEPAVSVALEAACEPTRAGTGRQLARAA